MSAAAAALVEVAIDGLGAAGDGLAHHAGRRVFVPFTLPGERWRVRLEGERGTAVEPLALTSRQAPPCRHFGVCGGCALQHAPPSLYARFKRTRILEALHRRGLEQAAVAEPAISPLGSRRRLRLASLRTASGLRLGLRQRLSHWVLPLEECPIARAELVALIAPLAAGLAGLPVEEVTLTATRAGVAAAVRARGRLDLRRRERLAGLADRHDLAALHWGEEPVAVRRQPCLEASGVTLTLPPHAFLQATAEGEAALTAAVAEWGQGARRVLDLYAGLGTLGLRLAAEGAHLRSVDAHAPALAALKAALPAVTVEPRDLARRPLAGPELKGTDLVILDPPRAGAAAQIAALATSPVPRIVYAACSPETFARDARTLADAGYALIEIRPIDQFLFSAEIELIALLERQATPKKP